MIYILLMLFNVGFVIIADCFEMAFDDGYLYVWCTESGCTVGFDLAAATNVEVLATDFSSESEHLTVFVDDVELADKCDPGKDGDYEHWEVCNVPAGAVRMKASSAVGCCKFTYPDLGISNGQVVVRYRVETTVGLAAEMESIQFLMVKKFEEYEAKIAELEQRLSDAEDILGSIMRYNPVVYEGYFYAVMDGTPRSESEIRPYEADVEFIEMPTGWEFAEDTPGVRLNVVKNPDPADVHGWGADCITFAATKECVNTRNGELRSIYSSYYNQIIADGNKYKPARGNTRILIRRPEL